MGSILIAKGVAKEKYSGMGQGRKEVKMERILLKIYFDPDSK